MDNNIVELVGILSNDFELDHESKTESFFKNTVLTKRYSGTVDKVNILVPKNKIGTLHKGDKVEIKGHFYSKDVQEHLVLYVYVKDITLLSDEFFLNKNDIILQGFVCKPSVYRETPLGRTICDVYLAVNRPSGRNDYIPCVAWGKIARQLKDVKVGTLIKIKGRVQSREYIKNEQPHTVYEVSIMEVL